MASLKIEGGVTRTCAVCAVEFVSRHSPLCLPCMLQHRELASPEPTPPVTVSPGRHKAQSHLLGRSASQAPPPRSKAARQRNAERIAQWHQNHPDALLPKAAPAVTLPQVRPAQPAPISLSCPLCGEALQAGEMLIHKEAVHGERRVVPSPATDRHSGQYVHVHQGGLPSLGKRAR